MVTDDPQPKGPQALHCSGLPAPRLPFRAPHPTPVLSSQSWAPGLQGPGLALEAPGLGCVGGTMPTAGFPPGLCLLQANLTKSQNEFKIILKELEDSLLARLSAASGNFLGDTALVENLETTKHTASEIEEKVSRPRPLSAPPSDESPQDGFRGSQGLGPTRSPHPLAVLSTRWAHSAPLFGFRY